MARKGKNKTGPRNPDGSRRAKPDFSQVAVSQGNPYKKTSSVSARAAIEQLLLNGYFIVTTGHDDAAPNKDQLKAMQWIAREYRVAGAKTSIEGKSVYMAHRSNGLMFYMPFKDMLTMHAVQVISEKTKIHLEPTYAASRREERHRLTYNG
jgi:hypothetical protein